MSGRPENDGRSGKALRTWHRTTSLPGLSERLSRYVSELYRRRRWLTRNAGPRKLANLALNGLEAAARKQSLMSLPSVVKIDVTPLCNLHCPACVHAKDGPQNLSRQRFTPDRRMNVDQYRRVIDQVRDTAITVSPYFMGDPLMHPDIVELCRITADAGINMHLSTNLSFNLGPDWIEELVASGLSHLTVCVDGLTQETYGRTRVGGRIERVLRNLAAVCKARDRAGAGTPEIEVQYIKYEHNLHELDAARRQCEDLGVDQFAELWGSTRNWTVERPLGDEPRGPWLFPRCLWPYTTIVVKYDGDVLPCCLHRIGEHYVDGGDSRPVGNLFREDLADVWNSPAY
ncbi:MAG: radical SAM protein, partial [Deltaproteobacteria bacterium]|nr:radical SAM protein [Deltaproteobacteria bacterium]